MSASLYEEVTPLSSSEHVDFTAKERDAWERLIRPHLLDVNRRRIPFEKYRETRALAAKEVRAFTWSGFIVHSDHSIPPEVDHDTLEYFFQRGSSVAEWGREYLS